MGAWAHAEADHMARDESPSSSINKVKMVKRTASAADDQFRKATAILEGKNSRDAKRGTVTPGWFDADSPVRSARNL